MVSVGYAVGHAQAAALDFADSPLDCRSPRRRCPSLIIEPDEQPRSSALLPPERHCIADERMMHGEHPKDRPSRCFRDNLNADQ